MMSTDARSLAGQRLGAYQLEVLLDIGGLAECFKAHHVELRREVAVTLLPGSLIGGRNTLTALREETRRVSALKHPNILPIYGIAETRDILYAVTPIPSESLRDRLDREDLVPAADAVRLAAQLAWALHALHGIGLVHGDVQPGTLLFDADGTLQLADFGIARALERQRGPRSRIASRTWPLAGVRSYIAPEVAETGHISVRGDIYALGAVLYEMLIGTLPRQQATLGEPELVTAPLPPSMRSSETWPELAAVALRALERDPAKRYPDARAFAIALRRAVIAEPEPQSGPSLRQVLMDVWHPEDDARTGSQEVVAFRHKLATMPPASAAAQQPNQPTLRQKLATTPPVPTVPPAPPSASAASRPPEDTIATTLLPNRSAPTPEPSHEDVIATTLLPDRPPRPALHPAAQSPAPPSQPPAPLPDAPPAQLPLHHPAKSRPVRASFYAETKPLHMDPPPLDPPEPLATGEDDISPAELARTLAGRRPGRSRRITAGLAGVALLLAFAAGAAGVLIGIDAFPAANASVTATTTSATATSGISTTPTLTAPTATVVLSPARHSATKPLPTPTRPPKPSPTP